MTPFNINLSEFSEDDFYKEFSKDTLRISKLFVNSNRELKRLSKKNSL
jgi:hypothetical protein